MQTARRLFPGGHPKPPASQIAGNRGAMQVRGADSAPERTMLSRSLAPKGEATFCSLHMNESVQAGSLLTQGPREQVTVPSPRAGPGKSDLPALSLC